MDTTKRRRAATTPGTTPGSFAPEHKDAATPVGVDSPPGWVVVQIQDELHRRVLADPAMREAAATMSETDFATFLKTETPRLLEQVGQGHHRAITWLADNSTIQQKRAWADALIQSGLHTKLLERAQQGGQFGHRSTGERDELENCRNCLFRVGAVCAARNIGIRSAQQSANGTCTEAGGKSIAEAGVQ